MQVGCCIPRPEYPRPQMVREQWLNLNGEWQFEIDNGNSGKERELYKVQSLKDTIIVPFCPESKLSGVENKDFMSTVWYKRTFEIPTQWDKQCVLLHFGAVDYKTELWVNGYYVGSHVGGYVSFSFDITPYIVLGENDVTVCAVDQLRSGQQPKGKQSSKYHSFGCDYTRTTGIWQTVWLECVHQSYISHMKFTPDIDNQCLHIEAKVLDNVEQKIVKAKAWFEGTLMGETQVFVNGKTAYITLMLAEKYLWEPGAPNLYDLELSLQAENGVVIDSVKSYFGLRSVTLTKNEMLLNKKPIFQRLVLDQGFYPDGIYTAPSDADIKNDIELAMQFGFNGARMHQKIFEARYLYWADKLGFLLWEEHASWGLDITTATGLENFLPEWIEALERDVNSPAIVGWCPFNETWDKDYIVEEGVWDPRGTRQDDEVIRIVYRYTKMYDKTRPVIDTSGNYHVETDIFDVHDYEQDVKAFQAKFEPMKHGGEPYVNYANRQKYGGEPYFVSEYGGIWWNPNQHNALGWGYGNKPASKEEFLIRYEGLTMTLLDNHRICGFCYTQLYDIEQEVNGLCTYDRKPKFDPSIIKEINMRTAAIEKLK